jgi:prevent-host-death family protein
MINIHTAKSQLSKLIERALDGEAVIIAKSGKPLVKLVALSADEKRMPRIGFMRGEIEVPDDFDQIDVTSLFAGKS